MKLFCKIMFRRLFCESYDSCIAQPDVVKTVAMVIANDNNTEDFFMVVPFETIIKI